MATPEEQAIVPVAEAPTPQPAGEIVQVRSAFDIAPQQFKAGLERRKKNRKALMDWIRDALVEGTDYGRIHVVKKDTCDKGKWCDNPYHFSKPSLWKAGAEKIAGMMGLRASWPDIDHEIERARSSTEAVLGLKCQLLDNGGNVVSEGVGARSMKQDFGDANKALKMAKKSSLIDAVLNAGGLSEVFTQDVEDMPAEQIATQSDPYQAGEDRIDHAVPQEKKYPLETHCPIGRDWKNVPWEQVDGGFLWWILEKIDDKPDLVARARREADSRSVETDQATERRAETKTAEPPAKRMADYARALADATNVDQITVIKDEIPEEFEPALRTYIAAREVELGPQTGA